MNEYIGHSSQLYGVEEHRLCGGKGDGMRLFEVNNGNGIMFTVSADRCGDISRLYFDGKNIGFFAPCGYVSPKYYDKQGFGFLKSFTAGFFTTCGLTNVGGPCNDNGEELPQHGNISNIPAEHVNWWIDDSIHIILTMRDASLFGHKLILTREYECLIGGNEIIIKDTVKNIGEEEVPYTILYHFNMGYPLLSENSVVTIESNGCEFGSEAARKGEKEALIMEKPQAGFEEQCFFHDMTSGKAKIYNPDIKTSLTMSFDLKELPCFTEWKMMGKGQYVLGLEPGNCNPIGRVAMREKGELNFLKAGEERKQSIIIKLDRE